MKEKVSVLSAFNYGIKAAWQHFWFLLSVYLFSLILFIIVFLPGISFNAAFFSFLFSATRESSEAVKTLFVEHLFKSWATFISICISFVMLKVVFDILRLGSFRVLLDLHDKGHSSIKRLFACTGIFYRYTVASILSALAIGLGLILFIVPGIIIMLRLSFFPYLLADKEVGIIKSLSTSWRRTKGQTWPLFCLASLFFIMVIALQVLSRVVSLVTLQVGPAGLLMRLFEVSATVYVVFVIGFAWVYIYRRLNKELVIGDV